MAQAVLELYPNMLDMCPFNLSRVQVVSIILFLKNSTLPGYVSGQYLCFRDCERK